MTGDIAAEAETAGLFVAGVANEQGGSLVLLGAAASFWSVLQNAPEIAGPDPVDRYSARVISDLATRFDASPVFPFGGPPYAPFLRWAVDSGRAWPSPVGMLVHETAGLMISYRGALRFDAILEDTAPRGRSPCETCLARPCEGACPVGALAGRDGYDVGRCHGYLDTGPGHECMSQGCRARRACPVSQQFGRDPAQSAYHMRIFHNRRDYH